ncbi:MAG: outer membrane beta-barrel protein [Balneolaceae bacterium]|nr:outer membrane beta-barrel protein [Balneolaceae bacterium]
MKSLYKYTLTAFIAIIAFAFFPAQADAQWGIGGTYQIRSEVPENGYGIRIHRGILKKLPLVDLGLRAHFTFFTEDVDRTVEQFGNTFNFTEEITTFDYGLDAVGGISVGLVKPYVGLGLGANTFNLDLADASDDPQSVLPAEGEDTKLFWNVFGGAEVSIIPALKPFVEYRFVGLDSPDVDIKEEDGRVVFGVMLYF